MARPNVLLFGDDAFVRTRRDEQRHGFLRWLTGTQDSRLAIVEVGAGLDIPTVRWRGEMLARRANVRLVRINLRDPESPAGAISIQGRALDITRVIDGIFEAPEPTYFSPR